MGQGDEPACPPTARQEPPPNEHSASQPSPGPRLTAAQNTQNTVPPVQQQPLSPQLHGLVRFRDDVLRELQSLQSSFLPRDLKKKLAPLQDTAQTVSQDLDRALTVHQELLARTRTLEDSIATHQAAQHQQQQQVQAGAATAAPGPAGGNAGGQTRRIVHAAEPQVEVRLDKLPRPQDWDKEWTDRIRGLQPRDAALLHRQFLQKAAALLPSIIAFGADTPNHERLSQVLQEYRLMIRGIRNVNPAAEEQRAGYDLESLTAGAAVDDQRLTARFQACLDQMDAQRVCDAWAAWQLLTSESNSIEQQGKELMALLGEACSNATSMARADLGAGGARSGASPRHSQKQQQQQQRQQRFGGWTGGMSSSTSSSGQAQGSSTPETAAPMRQQPLPSEHARAAQHAELLARSSADINNSGSNPSGSGASVEAMPMLDGGLQAGAGVGTKQPPPNALSLAVQPLRPRQDGLQLGSGGMELRLPAAPNAHAAPRRLLQAQQHWRGYSSSSGAATDGIAPGMMVQRAASAPDALQYTLGGQLAAIDDIDDIAAQLQALLQKKQAIRDVFFSNCIRIFTPVTIVSFALQFYPLQLELLDVFTRCSHLLEAEAKKRAQAPDARPQQGQAQQAQQAQAALAQAQKLLEQELQEQLAAKVGASAAVAAEFLTAAAPILQPMVVEAAGNTAQRQASRVAAEAAMLAASDVVAATDQGSSAPTAG